MLKDKKWLQDLLELLLHRYTATLLELNLEADLFELEEIILWQNIALCKIASNKNLKDKEMIKDIMLKIEVTKVH